MTDLVLQNEQGQDITTSLIVAEVFGKRNSDVMRDIRNLSCSKDFHERNFALMVKMNKLPQGGAQKTEYYEMTKDGFSFLVMGYTGAKAGEFKEKFINEFNKREALLKDDDYILMRSEQILRKRIEVAEEKIKSLTSENTQIKEQNELQEKQLKEQAPDVEYTKKVLSASNTYSINLIAKEMGMSGVTLNAKLKEKGVQYKQGGVWVLTHKYQNKGYTSTRTHIYTSSDGKERTSMLTVWTERGRKFIHDLFKAA